MWLWLLKGSPKVRIFILKIILLSVTFHFILLFLLLFVYQSSSLQFLVKSNSSQISVPIIFLPFQKTVPGSLKALNKASGKEVKKNSKVKIILKNSLTPKKKSVISKNKIIIKQNSQ